jgi:signal transduction histidine kinase
MDRQVDATIQEEILGLASQYQGHDLIALSTAIRDRVASDLEMVAIYLLADARYRPIVGNINNWPDTPVDNNGWTRFRLQIWNRQPMEEHQVRARIFRLRGDLHLLVGRDVRELEATRRLVLDALGWGLAITAALAIGVALVMSQRVMRRIDTINQTSTEIMAGHLSRRMPIDGSGDDFDQLALNLNRMLDRIEALMAAVRQVSDNIAHDLRTPLTRLRTRLEQARSGDSERIPEQVDKAIEDTEELLTTFNALLRIARIESSKEARHLTELDLAALIQDIAELYEPVAAERDQRLQVEVEGPLVIQGDRDLLFQAFANLVDNAIKHTPPGSAITLAANAHAEGVEASVSDTGPGIQPELYEKVFQRFYRTDASRTTQGSGLGLSLVKAIADMHHARIELGDNQPGLWVGLVFAKGRAGVPIK